MTVVPDGHLMTLICDTCDESVTARACVLPDAEVVWTLVAEHGWSGSPFATGPHRCPRCIVTPVPGTAGDRAMTGTYPTASLGIDYLDEVAELGVDAARGRTGVDGVPAGAGTAARYDDAPAPRGTGEALRNAIAEAVDLGDHLVVDLARVPSIDPDGLGLLVRAYREARERDVVLCLAAPSRFVLTVLHTMRLDGIFPVFDSRADALAELGGTVAGAGNDPTGFGDPTGLGGTVASAGNDLAGLSGTIAEAGSDPAGAGAGRVRPAPARARRGGPGQAVRRGTTPAPERMPVPLVTVGTPTARPAGSTRNARS